MKLPPKQRDLLTLDFESYYADDFSLSKMTAIEYVNDPRFQLILFSVKRNNEPTVWFTGTWEESIVFLSKYKIEESIVAGHNMSEFDSLILWKMGFVPYRYICTLQLARFHGLQDAAGGSLAALCKYFGLKDKGDEVVHAKNKRLEDFTDEQLQRYGEYCVNDTDRTYELLQIMIERGVPAVEWVIMDIKTKFAARPRLVLDRPLLERYAETLANRQEEILADLNLTPAELSSNDKFADVLRGMGIEPPRKESKTTAGKMIYAFAKSDTGMQELLNSDDEEVAAVAAARLNVKSTIEASRTERFLSTGAMMGGLMPMPQRAYGAHTGRGSGTMKLNMLNLSARKREPVLKKALLAPEGYLVISGDSSQIELRGNAYSAGQDDLLQNFREGRDTYREFAATELFHKPLEEIAKDSPERQIAKSAVLGAGFMMGAKRFKEYVRIETGMIISLEEAQRVIATYRARYSKIADSWNVAKVVIMGLVHGESYSFGRDGWLTSNHVDKTIKLPSGRFLRYPGIRIERLPNPNTGELQDTVVYDRKMGRGGVRKVFLHPGLLVENYIQAIARDVVMWQMAKISQRYEVVTSTYDENVFIAPESEREEALAYGKACMLQGPKWLGDMPLGCEIGAGKSYGEA